MHYSRNLYENCKDSPNIVSNLLENYMISFLITLICVLSLWNLYRLCVIDLKTRLLPNTFVAGFFALGWAFHILTLYSFVSVYAIALGMIAGAGLLLSIRAVANFCYKQDALGLGDVKLMGAAGVWLGLEGIFMAITLGALAGLVHGVAHKFWCEKDTPFAHLSIPAGPGFIAGILAVAIYQFWDLPKFLLDFHFDNMLSL